MLTPPDPGKNRRKMKQDTSFVHSALDWLMQLGEAATLAGGKAGKQSKGALDGR